MELDGWIDSKDDEDMLDGEASGIGDETVRTTHPIIFCSLIWFFAEIWVFWMSAVVHIAGVCAYSHPRSFWACYEQLRSKIKFLKIVSIDLDSNKHVTISSVLY